MSSAFVVTLAYWHGELTHNEAARHIAMARLLLEYPRWRWGEKLNAATQILLDISGLADFDIYKLMLTLLPELSQSFLRSLCESSPADGKDDTATDQTKPPADAFLTEVSWPINV